MICPNCSTVASEDQSFCGKCGHKLTPDTVASLSERLTSIETILAADSRSKALEQKYLELETSEKIVTRVMGWTKMFLYWVAIPYAALLLVLGVIVGKGELDLHNIATNAKDSVSAIVQQAREEASKAKETANEALNTSKQVNQDTLDTKRRVGELRTQVESRSTDVQKLGGNIKAVEQQVSGLKAATDSQSQQMQHLNQQMRTVTIAKNVTDIRRVFPLYGTHVAQSQSDGWLDPNTKPAGIKYVALNLSVAGNTSTGATLTPSLSDESVGKAITVLSDRKYHVLLGVIYTYAKTNNSSQAIGISLDPNSCGYWPDPPAQPPCIMYFNESFKTAALEVRNVFRDVQTVSEDRVLYVDPKRLTAQKRELLALSAVDIAVVLTDVLH